jgi:hypothetical protein
LGKGSTSVPDNASLHLYQTEETMKFQAVPNLFTALIVLTSISAAQAQTKFGEFQGDVITKWLTTGEMELYQDVVFVDAKSQKWLASKGTKINGASIPRACWTIVGDPYDKRFRRASVIHDAYCTSEALRKERTWKEVHRMFYDGCRADGTGEKLAYTLYGAVYQFGPQWNEQGKIIRRYLDFSGTTYLFPGQDVGNLALLKPIRLSPEAVLPTVEAMERPVILVEDVLASKKFSEELSPPGNPSAIEVMLLQELAHEIKEGRLNSLEEIENYQFKINAWKSKLESKTGPDKPVK